MILKGIIQIIVCYIAGIIAGNLVVMMFLGPLAIFFIIYGAMLAIPALAIAILVFIVFHSSIRAHTLAWCVAAPLLVVLFWLTFEWQASYSNRDKDIFLHLSQRVVWERTGLAFICSSISAWLFWYWNRKPAIAAI